ncbi:hypothetical protein PQR75_40735 [Paraburkholderia fungorum]|uniref:hypothetical protein n=1 Tax=Paraburkholderia fungorum TaxID=134537 RepID=UPI0038B7393F
MSKDPPPRTAADLKARLQSEAFDGTTLSDDLIDRFVRSIIYNDGEVAHMEYGDVKKALSEIGFSELLSLLGISPPVFI